MLRLLTALSEMTDVLVSDSVQAPRRQLDGVASWRGDVAWAVSAGRAYKDPAGMAIDDQPRLSLPGVWARPPHVRFLHGHPTHRAWRDLCRAIQKALAEQQEHADQIQRYWAKAAKRARTREQRAAALQQMQLAATWQTAATVALDNGDRLIRREDEIMRPVGKAIARAGGINEVARNRFYHQRWI